MFVASNILYIYIYICINVIYKHVCSKYIAIRFTICFLIIYFATFICLIEFVDKNGPSSPWYNPFLHTVRLTFILDILPRGSWLHAVAVVLDKRWTLKKWAGNQVFLQQPQWWGCKVSLDFQVGNSHRMYARNHLNFWKEGLDTENVWKIIDSKVPKWIEYTPQN